MHSIAVSVAGILALAAPAIASPLAVRQTTAAAALKNWNVTSVVSFTPSGRPVRRT